MEKVSIVTSGRADKVLDGLWRLRLPLPWAGISHVNAFAIATNDGLILVDCGAHEQGSEVYLEQALGQIGFRIEDITTLICTHSHADHYGQAATVVERAGCELWIHPDSHYVLDDVERTDDVKHRRLRTLGLAGMPEDQLQAYAADVKRWQPAVKAVVKPHRELINGVEFKAKVGRFEAVETPGHSPCHVCLYLPERNLLISGDHLIGTNTFYYEYGLVPDPVTQFKTSLERVQGLGVELCLGGHARPFRDVDSHITAIKERIKLRLETTVALLKRSEATAYELLPEVYGEWLVPTTLSWALSKQLCHLEHLELQGLVKANQQEGSDPVTWSAK